MGQSIGFLWGVECTTSVVLITVNGCGPPCLVGVLYCVDRVKGGKVGARRLHTQGYGPTVGSGRVVTMFVGHRVLTSFVRATRGYGLGTLLLLFDIFTYLYFFNDEYTLKLFDSLAMDMVTLYKVPFSHDTLVNNRVLFYRGCLLCFVVFSSLGD